MSILSLSDLFDKRDKDGRCPEGLEGKELTPLIEP